MADHEGLESSLRAAIAERLGAGRFGLWFGDGVRLGVDGDDLRVDVPNGFFQQWIESHFAGTLIDAGRAVAGRDLRLSFHVEAETEPCVGDVVEAPNAPGRDHDPITVVIPKQNPAAQPTPATAPAPSRERPRAQSTRPLRRLDDFVLGPCNRLAHAAAVETAEHGAAAFNPLVIYGGVGLGKTHLLEGIAFALRSKRQGLQVAQTTTEAFTNGFLEAIRGGSLASFRAKFRRADALILDDVHFLASKRATQDEFLHTFNALIAAGAPVVVAADQHPRRIAKLSDEVATRLLAGMVVKLDAPDVETRRGILKAKGLARGVALPDAVVDYVAEHLRGSVRELEGALNSLVAHAVLTGKRLDLTLAKVALRDTIRHTARAVGLRDVERAVCELFAIDADTLKGEGRSKSSTYPRMIAMYLARKHTGAAYSEIGRHFGGRNHSTVISAEKQVAKWLRDEQRNGLLSGFETVGDVLAGLERVLGA